MVSPLPDSPLWGVFAIDGNYILFLGSSKHSCDCDFAAEMLAKGRIDIYENDNDNPQAAFAIKEFLTMNRSEITVDHCPEQREKLMQMQEVYRKKARKNAERRNDS
jgi:hypothetical protein